MGAHCTSLESVFAIRRLTGLDRKMCVVGSLDAPFTLAKGIDQEAIVLMFRCILFAPKGPDKTAQGNVLGTRKTAKNEGTSPERAQQPTGDVSPFQGSVAGFATATPGVARG
jgi:hypothetical protein